MLQKCFVSGLFQSCLQNSYIWHRAPEKISLRTTRSANALQRHADYFDGDKDGQITVKEAYRGMRDLGLGRGSAGLGAVAGNAFLGPATGAPWYRPLSIQTDNIVKGKHAGDSGTFD